jgi:hypothetical protein
MLDSDIPAAEALAIEFKINQKRRPLRASGKNMSARGFFSRALVFPRGSQWQQRLGISIPVAIN